MGLARARSVTNKVQAGVATGRGINNGSMPAGQVSKGPGGRSMDGRTVVHGGMGRLGWSKERAWNEVTRGRLWVSGEKCAWVRGWVVQKGVHCRWHEGGCTVGCTKRSHDGDTRWCGGCAGHHSMHGMVDNGASACVVERRKGQTGGKRGR